MRTHPDVLCATEQGSLQLVLNNLYESIVELD